MNQPLDRMSKADFARLMGWSDTRVSQLAREHRLVVDGATDAVGRIGKAAQDIGRDAAAIASAINGIATVIGKIDAASSTLSGGVKAVFGATTKTITEGVKLASEGVDAVTGKTSDFTKRITELDASAADLAKGGLKEFTDGAKELASVAMEATGGTDQMRASFESVQGGAQTVSEATAVAAQGFNAATGAVENAATALDILPELYGRDAVATNAATEAHNAHVASLEAARKAVDDARAALVDLAKSGETNSAAFQQASNALQAAQANLDQLTGKTREAVDAQAELAKAFGRLKVQTQADLEGAATAARESFEIIKSAFSNGKATIEEVRRAFEAYSKAQRAQVADSDQWRKEQVEDQLAVQASLVGLSDKFIRAGEAGKRSGEAMSEGLGDVKEAAEQAAKAVKSVKDAAIEEDRIGKEATKTNEKFAASMGGIVAITPDMAAALKLLNERLSQDANLTNVSLQEAQYLLSTLGPMAGAAAGILEKRISELSAAAERAADVARNMADEAASLQDEIDRLEGNDGDIENRRHAKKLADLEAEARASGKLFSAEYFELVRLENKLHDLKMQNLRKEKGGNAPRPGEGGIGRPGDMGAGAGSPPPPDESQGGGPAPTGGGGNGGPRRAPQAPSIQIHVQGSIIGGSPAQLADELARLITPAQIRIANRSR